MKFSSHNIYFSNTVDQEIFMLEIIIHVKIFCDGKFSWFCLVHEIFNGWWLQYGRVFLANYKVSGEIAGSNHRSDMYLGGCGRAYTLIRSLIPRLSCESGNEANLFVDHHGTIFFTCNFCASHLPHNTLQKHFVQFKPHSQTTGQAMETGNETAKTYLPV